VTGKGWVILGPITGDKLLSYSGATVEVTAVKEEKVRK
jgi:hypothetical protein